MFDETISKLPGEWRYIEDRENLTLENLNETAPRYVFFLHWSYKVPSEVLTSHECVVFHMTDVPYGRGGSPLQNLIVRGHKDTKISALRMTEEFDAGPVYMKAHLGLEGTAAEILERASEVSAGMIREIIEGEPVPKEQEGEPTVFRRRKPEEGRLPGGDLGKVYDHIRMLDADGYPPAFIDYEQFRLEFSKAVHRDGRVLAEVVIREREEA